MFVPVHAVESLRKRQDGSVGGIWDQKTQAQYLHGFDSPQQKGIVSQTKNPGTVFTWVRFPATKRDSSPRPKTEVQYLHGFDSLQQKGIVSQTKNWGTVFTWVRFPTTKRDSSPRPKTEVQYLHGFDSPQQKGIVLPDQKLRYSIYMGSIPHNKKG